MPRTEFHRDLSVKAAPVDAWTALVDVLRLVGWVSVVEDAVELEPLSKYTAVLMDRLGPFKLRANLDVTVSDVVSGQSLKVKAIGEDRQVGSRLLVVATMQERPEQDGSTIVVDGVWAWPSKSTRNRIRHGGPVGHLCRPRLLPSTPKRWRGRTSARRLRVWGRRCSRSWCTTVPSSPTPTWSTAGCRGPATWPGEST